MNLENLGLDKEHLRKRMQVLETALYIEGLTSSIICRLLDIDIETSKSFGNKSSSLSFSNKINLLLDMGNLHNDDVKKFEKFMSIRNQFMHNWSVDTFVNCVEKLDGLKNWLASNYPQDNNSNIELQYEKSINQLRIELTIKTASLIESIEKKINKEVKAKFYERFQKVLLLNLIDAVNKIELYIEENIEDDGKINISKFKGKFELLRKELVEKSIKSIEDQNDEQT